MARKNTKDDYCYYCKCVLSKSQKQMDNFPIPKEAGGEDTVPSCISCHDMKDRFNVSDWNGEWFARLTIDLEENVSRETRIFLAKVLRMVSLKQTKDVTTKYGRNDDEQRVLELINELRSEGFTLRQIREELESRGVLKRNEL